MLPVRLPARRSTPTLLPVSTTGEPGFAAQAAVAEPVAQPAATGPEHEARTMVLDETVRAVEEYARSMPYASGVDLPERDLEAAKVSDAERGPAAESADSDEGVPSETPSWIRKHALEATRVQGRELSADSLKKTRERIAARWYAFRGLFQSRVAEADDSFSEQLDRTPPLLGIFSLTGGAGKTSLAASLSRALAAQGERLLLVNLTSQRVLPFFFGAQGTRPGGRRVFAPPPGNPDAPIQLIDYDEDAGRGGRTQDDDLQARLARDGKGFSRVVVDVPTASIKDVQTLLQLGGSILVPLLPDVNSLLSLRGLRRLLGSEEKVAGTGGQLWFLLTQFDASQPLHIDVREMLEQELGEQLLPFVVRSSPAVAEALAQGMTVMDYAPGEGIAKDLQQIAAWVRTLVEPAREGLGQVRWSER